MAADLGTAVADSTDAATALALATALVQKLNRASVAETDSEAKQLVDQIRSLDRRGIDPFTAEYLVGGALEVETSLRGRVSHPPASLRIGVETIRQALTRVVEGREVSDDRPMHDLLRWLLTTLRMTHAELAQVLDVAPSTVRRWLDESRIPPATESEEMQRARVLAHVVASLSHVLTARGVGTWLITPHPGLKDRTPAQLLGEAAAVADLIGLASQGRSQVAS